MRQKLSKDIELNENIHQQELIGIYGTPHEREKDTHSLHSFQESIEFMSMYTIPRVVKQIQGLLNN